MSFFRGVTPESVGEAPAGFKEFDIGDNEAYVKFAEETTSKSSGKEMLVITFKNDKGAEIKHYIVNDEYKMTKLKQFYTAFKETGNAGCMIVFCAFDQQWVLIKEAKKHNFNNYINLVFYKNYSPQVLKANMRIVGNSEYALLFFRNKLPKFRNSGRMVFNCIPMRRDNETPKIHPTQKSIYLLKFLIDTFTDAGDVVIDPCAGSGVTLLAAEQLGRRGYGFEIKREYVKDFEKHIKPLAGEKEFLFDCVKPTNQTTPLSLFSEIGQKT